MLLKNLVLYRLPANWAVDADQLERNLAAQSLQPCGGFQMESRGWTSPQDDDAYLYQQQRQWLLALGVEQKILPASVIRQEAKERAQILEQQQGHPVGRKQMRDLRDEVVTELLPRALARRRTTWGWINAADGWLAVNAVADAKVEQFMESLRRADDSMQARRLGTQRSPASAMAEWLVQQDAPGAFTIDQDLELRSADAAKATVRYARHNLEGREIRDHIAAAKTVVRLGMTWNDKISFELTEQLQIKRISLVNVINEESEYGTDIGSKLEPQQKREQEQEQFALDFALLTGELSLMIKDLIKALDGEKENA